MISASMRDDFPLLARTVGKRPLVYFDNACMSLKPRQVVSAMEKYYYEMGACAGRSNHRLAREVTEAVERARKHIADYIGAKQSEEVIFTRNTTEGLNLVANSLELTEGDVVLTSGKEHNSNLVPWLKLVKTKGIVHTVIPMKDDNCWDMAAFEALLDDGVRLVSLVQTSNLDGVTFPIKEIARNAHKAGALVMIDAAQSIPHSPIDVTKLEVDLVAFSGHKMLGPTGTGVLWGNKELLERMDGFLVGGDTVEWTTYTDYTHLPLPEKFEAGLQDYAGIIGFGAAVEYLEQFKSGEIAAHEARLNEIVTGGLADMERVRILGPGDPKLRSGIVSFSVEGAHPHEVALMLDNAYGIMVRSGQHCVHSWFEASGIEGSVRASMYLYNTEAEAKYFVESLEKVLQVV